MQTSAAAHQPRTQHLRTVKTKALALSLKSLRKPFHLQSKKTQAMALSNQNR